MKNKIISFFIVLFFCLTFLCLNEGLQTIDDEVYKNVFFDFKSFVDWVQEFYSIWSGRVIVTSMITVFTNMPIFVFVISNTIIFGIFIVAIYWIINILFENLENKLKMVILIIIPCFFYCLKVSVISNGCLWLTGALNYFWPVTCMLITIIPFICELKSVNISSKYYIMFYIMNLISAMVEQTALVLICFGLITLVILKKEKKKINKLLIIHFVMITILFLICMLAPGNIIRANAEKLLWYNDFDMLLPLEQVNQGFFCLLDNFMNGNTILFTYLIIQLIYLKCKQTKINKLDVCTIITFTIYLFLTIIFKFSSNSKLIDFEINKLYKIDELFKIIFNYIVIGNIGIELLYIMEDKKNGLIIGLLYFASICSVLVLGFSPTIFASASRIFVLADLLLILINVALAVEILKEEKNRLWIDYIVITTIIALATYCNLLVNVTDKIIY